MAATIKALHNSLLRSRYSMLGLYYRVELGPEKEKSEGRFFFFQILFSCVPSVSPNIERIERLIKTKGETREEEEEEEEEREDVSIKIKRVIDGQHASNKRSPTANRLGRRLPLENGASVPQKGQCLVETSLPFFFFTGFYRP